MWADNGDAISREYAGSAALKGDYTRTSKRNYQGALRDFSLTLSRYYNNIVNDFFSQAGRPASIDPSFSFAKSFQVIDYLLGNVTDRVFEEFEANLMSGDPAMSIPKIRQNAIDISAKIVIEDPNEELRGGWAVLTPHPNTLRSLPLEEVILLLTDRAVYSVRFDWDTEKVGSFERVALQSITGVQRGTYITSTFTYADTDPQRNIGLVVRYKPGIANISRVNTRSMSTTVDPADVANSRKATKDPKDGRFLAFKAPADRSGITGDGGNLEAESPMSESAVVQNICEEFARAVGEDEDWVVQKEIISPEEARKSVGLLEQWSYTLKRFVWA